MNKWKFYFLQLVPGGSEFCNNPEKCYEYVRDLLLNYNRKVSKLTNELETLREEYTQVVNYGVDYSDDIDYSELYPAYSRMESNNE